MYIHILLKYCILYKFKKTRNGFLLNFTWFLLWISPHPHCSWFGNDKILMPVLCKEPGNCSPIKLKMPHYSWAKSFIYIEQFLKHADIFQLYFQLNILLLLLIKYSFCHILISTSWTPVSHGGLAETSPTMISY